MREESENLNKELESKEILKWAISTFPKICIAASFGKDSVVVLHLLKEIKPDIDVIYIDTGYEFPETIAFVEKLKKEWNLNLKVYRPAMSVEEQEKIYGKLYFRDPDKCCGFRKVEPMGRALQNYDAWITGLRMDETEFRKNIKIVESQNGITKINPIARWCEADVWDYINRNRIPYNPLYDKGYRSLGCKPCTLAGKWGRFERAGRWTGTGKQECGLHLEEYYQKYSSTTDVK